MTLPVELRETFAALWVAGDGNCFWRALSKALWGLDKCWRQLKLVVLSWSPVNVDALVGEGSPLHLNVLYFTAHIHVKYGTANYERDNYAGMLMENVGWFCRNKRWCGDLGVVLAAEALGVAVKLVVPTDKLAREKVKAKGPASGEPAKGLGKKGCDFGDNRKSRWIQPTDRTNITLRGGMGSEGDVVVEELAIVLTDVCAHSVEEKALAAIAATDADSTFGVDTWVHFAAIASKDRARRPPLPMHEVAPPMFSQHDEASEQKTRAERAAWERRQNADGGKEAAVAAAAAKANTKQGDDKQKGAEDGKEEGGEGGKGRDGGATGGDSAEAAVEKARQESAEALLAASEKAEQAREGAKKAKTLYHKLKLAVTEGHRQRVADVERNKHEWVRDTSLADGRLLRKRVAAAKARRGYDKAWKNLRRTETRMAKMFGGEGGGVDPGNEDSDSSTTSSKAARNWNSDDDLSMGGGYDSDDSVLPGPSAAGMARREEQERHVQALRTTAKEAKKKLNSLVAAVDETDDGIEGPNDREKACGEQRVAAARAWKQFKKAERALQKLYRNSDDTSSGSEEDVDSDGTDGWDSQDDVFSDEDADKEDDDDKDHIHVDLVKDFSFSVDENDTPEETWEKTLGGIRAALHRAGHKGATFRKTGKKVGGGSSRVGRYEIKCQGAGKAPPNTGSKKGWSVKVILDHQTNPECEVPKIAQRANQDNLIDVAAIQRDWEGQIRTWTSGGVRVLNMHRLIELEIAPLKLGPPGRRKVRNLSTNARRNSWGTAKDAVLLIEALLKDSTCKCTWKMDSFNQLAVVMWSTAEQQISARQFGGVVIQDNTCLTNRYNMKLCLFVGVDSENKTTIFAQGLLANEQIPSFEFAIDHLIAICGGHPKAFQTIWEKVSNLVKGTKCESYITGHVYTNRKHWARCYHPTTLTLNMTASQRVEGGFSVIKNGRMVNKRSSLMAVKKEAERVAEKLALQSRWYSTRRTFYGKEHVEADAMKTGEPIKKELEQVNASKYAKEEVINEIFASPAYSTEILTEGAGALDYLNSLATRQEDGEAIDVCCELPESVVTSLVEDDVTDTTMYGTTSLLVFARLVESVEINTVVKVLYKMRDPQVGHIVVVGPNNFQLCSCLQILRTGLPCRHLMAVLLYCLRRPAEFSGMSIHPRWRATSGAWSVELWGLRELDAEECGPLGGGLTDDRQMDFGDGEGSDGGDAPDNLVSVIRGRAFANWLAKCTASVKLGTDNVDRKNPDFLAKAEEVVDRFCRGMAALVQSDDRPSDPFNLSGLRNPPIPVSKNRKESRVQGACEGRPSKRIKQESV
eukprot:jgi/Undpi1/7851/HiC_scaffold_23.g10323.m1